MLILLLDDLFVMFIIENEKIFLKSIFLLYTNVYICVNMDFTIYVY